MIHGHGGNIYALARQLACDPADIVDLSSNINPLGMPPGLLDVLRDNADLAGLLPEVDGRAMVESMAQLLALDPDRMLAGNGTTQFIYTACPALGSRQVLILGPAYADYADACRMYGLAPRYHLLRPSNAFEVDMQVLDREVSACDTVFICNPNNPTASLIPARQLTALCQRHPRIRFIIDESYLPFVPEDLSASMAHSGLDNVIVLWSVSKIFGLPGLRAGFLVAPGAIRKAFERFMQPWCVNSLAQAAVLALGRNQAATLEFIRRTRAFLAHERELFRQRLSSLGSLTIFPSVTSYLLMELPRSMSADDVCGSLARQRLLIRNCGNFQGLSDRYVRVALKSGATNEKAAGMLVEVLKGVQSSRFIVQG